MVSIWPKHKTRLGTIRRPAPPSPFVCSTRDFMRSISQEYNAKGSAQRTALVRPGEVTVSSFNLNEVLAGWPPEIGVRVTAVAGLRTSGSGLLGRSQARSQQVNQSFNGQFQEQKWFADKVVASAH